jgi:hypothetical protein
MSQARVSLSRSWLAEQDFPLPAGCAQRHRQGVKTTFPVRRSLTSWREKSIWVAGQPNQFLMNPNASSSHSPISFELDPLLVKDAPFGRR